jgi:outer membrane protein
VQLNVPIYQGGFVTARTRESVQRLEEQMQRLEQAHRTAQSQTRQAYLGIISGISEVEAFKQALVSAETALEATEAGFEVGTRTAVDVVTAQRATSQARREYARARYDYLLDTLRLKRAAGIISSEDLARVNQWLN